ncbi:MAG TPA: OmpA family protein [Turneriella sp.]|nr:OmpA family protein [Turneriella sp.]
MRLIYIFVLAFLVACSTTPENETPVRFDEIITQATQLSEKGSVDEAKYARLVEALERIRRTAPQYKEDASSMLLAANFMKLFPSVTCELTLTEPNEPLYIDEGFTTPLKVRATCPVKAPFAFEADSQYVELKGENFAYDDGKLTAELRVTSVNALREKNKLRFAAHYYASPLLKLLREDFNSVDSSIIAINPVEYTIAQTPSNKENTVNVASRGVDKNDIGVNPTQQAQVQLKVIFMKGSIQLSREARQKIADMRLKPGQKIRVTGFADAESKSKKDKERIANLRARVVASFLNEAVGITDAAIEWKTASENDLASTALIEGVE